MIGGMKRNVSHGKMRDRADGSPCVLVLRLTAEEMRGRAPVSACVASDADALAEAAFDELARQGVASFAYVPFTDPDWSWSRARGEAFARRVRVSGAAFSGFSAPESGERLPKGRAVAFGVSQVVRRASTRRLVVYDGRVARALEFIRLHATDRITPPDVVAVMGCRRSYADQRFRECTGHTILDEIRSRRVGRVKELVRCDACDRASQYCHSGFASMIDLRRVFKALTGQTLSQWRAAHAHGTAP